MPRANSMLLLMLVLILLNTPTNARADAARGKALAQRWCAGCHGVASGQASTDPKAPTFSAIAAEPSVTETSLRVFLRTPHSTMPNIMLAPDDKDDIIDYLLSSKPQH